MKNVYLLLAIAGAALPMLALAGIFGGEPLPAPQYWLQTLYVNVGTAASFTDLAWASLVFWLFAFAESARLGMRRPWLWIVINCLVGLSCALPLFLYARLRRIEAEERHAAF